MRLKNSQVAVFFLLCCSVGCDGVYLYSIHGTVYEADGHTPAQQIRLRAAEYKEALDNCDNCSVVTDLNGHFESQTSRWTNLGPRPPAPMLKHFYVLTPEGPPAVEFNLAAIPQPISRLGRDITLPPIILKRPTSGPATNP